MSQMKEKPTNLSEINKILFSPDEPIKDSKHDVFDHKYFVDVIKYIIINCSTPLNVALYGKWGVGKSSILNFLREEIDSNRDLKTEFRFIVIDVWKLTPSILKQEFLESMNQKLDNPIKLEKIEEELWHSKKVVPPITPMIDLKSKATLKWLSFYGAIFGAVLGIGIGLDYVIEEFDMLTPSIMVSAAIPIVLASINALQQISKNTAKSVTKIIPRIESSSKFQELFKKIIGRFKDQKLIIAIDNLDRCDDESVVNILNMIKIFLNEPRCIFIVACDQDAIIKHLQRKNGQFMEERDAIEFLTKFFQITLRIPPQIKGQLYSYAEDQLRVFERDIKPDPDVADVFANAITMNPRKIRQFVYNFVIAYRLAVIKESKGTIAKDVITGNTAFLAKTIVLKEEWPDFFRRLEKNPTLLDVIQKHIDYSKSDDKDTELNNILEQNDGLEHFLKSTSVAKSIQPLLFIQLNQESFESSLSELNNLILKVNQNDVKAVKRILKNNFNERHGYVLELCQLTDQYINDKRNLVANNSINMLINVYDMVNDQSKKEIIDIFNRFISAQEILIDLMNFDINILFPITSLLEPNSKEAVQSRYAELLGLPENYPIVLEGFIQNADMINESIYQKIDENLSVLGLRNKELLYTILISLQDKQLEKKFIREHVLGKMIEWVDPLARDKWMELYLKLRHLASEHNQQRFVKKMLDKIQPGNENVMPPVHEKIFQIFREMTADDFSQSAAKITYDSLKELVLQYSETNQKTIVFATILKTYTNLNHIDKEDFATNYFAPWAMQLNASELSSVLKIVKSEETQILEFDAVIDSIFSRLKQEVLSADLVTRVYACIPKTKWDYLEDKLIQLHKNTNTVEILSDAFRTPGSMPEKLKTKIFEQLLKSSKQLGPDQKYTIYSNLIESLENLNSAACDSFADELMYEIQSEDNQFNQNCEFLKKCFKKTTKNKKIELVKTLSSRMENLVSSNFDRGVILLKCLMSINKDMPSKERKEFVDSMIQKMADSYPEPIIMAVLNLFHEIDFGDKKDLAYSCVDKLQNSSNDSVKIKAQKIMNRG